MFHALFDVIINLGKNPIKLRQRPNMTIAVDWDVKHQFKQTLFSAEMEKKKRFIFSSDESHFVTVV